MPRSIPTTEFPSAPSGWTGPHEGFYLPRYCNEEGELAGRRLSDAKRYLSFDEAAEAAEEIGDKCGGITMEYNLKRKRYEYTLRLGRNLKEKKTSKHLAVASWKKVQEEVPEETFEEQKERFNQESGLNDILTDLQDIKRRIQEIKNTPEGKKFYPNQRPTLLPPSFFEKKPVHYEIEKGEIIPFSGLIFQDGMSCTWNEPIGILLDGSIELL